VICMTLVLVCVVRSTKTGRGCNSTPRPPCMASPKPCTTKKPELVLRCPACVNSRCTPNACNLAVGIYYPGDCSKFCKCDHGGAIKMSCPPGLLFEESLGVCVWPQESTCSNSVIYPGCEEN
jgi:hypothetical protein